MKHWHAPRDSKTILLLLGMAVFISLALGGLIRLGTTFNGPLEEWPISFSLFLIALATCGSLLIVVVLLDRVRQLASTTYTVDRNKIHVLRRDRRYTIPLDQIVGMQVADSQPPQTSKPLLALSHGQSAHTLLIETQQYVYTLVVQDREAFLRHVEERRQLGVVQTQREGVEWTRPVWRAFATSQTIQRLMIAAIALNVVLWGAVSWRYPDLPDTVPVRFDPIGGTAGTRAKTYTLLLPVIGTLILLGNTLLAARWHRNAQLASELLLVGTLIVHLVLLVGAWFILRVGS